MAPKKGSPAPAAVPASAAKPTTSVSSAAGQPTKPANKPAAANTPNSIKNAQDVQQIGFAVWNNYMDTTPQRTKLLDSFMAFLIVVAGIQFLYCLIAGNFVRFPHRPRNTEGWTVLDWWTILTLLRSPSTPSSPASPPPSASSSSQPACAFRRTRRTRASSARYHMRGK